MICLVLVLVLIFEYFCLFVCLFGIPANNWQNYFYNDTWQHFRFLKCHLQMSDFGVSSSEPKSEGLCCSAIIQGEIPPRRWGDTHFSTNSGLNNKEFQAARKHAFYDSGKNFPFFSSGKSPLVYTTAEDWELWWLLQNIILARDFTWWSNCRITDTDQQPYQPADLLQLFFAMRFFFLPLESTI